MPPFAADLCLPDRMDVVQRVVIVVPTYNEAENIRPLVAGIRTHLPQADVLVVDDDSPDGTGAIADALAAVDPHVAVLHRTRKGGLGAAYLHAFGVALERGYDVIGEMDADGSHQPADLPRLLAALEHADLVIGSRYVPGGQVVNWPWHRRALSRGGNAYTRLLLGMDVRDTTAGFRLFRRDALERLDLGTVQAYGYVFQAEMVHRAVGAGLRVREVPIAFVERERGTSKMTAGIARESLVRITRWGLRHRLDRVQDRLHRQARGRL